MGIKMTKAYSEKLARLVEVEEVNKQNRDELQLKCPSEECRVNITYTDEHTKTYGDTLVYVPSYFRLISEQNHPHTNECYYSTIGELKSTAKRSNGILKELEDHRFEFRLQVIKRGISPNNQDKLKSIEAPRTQDEKPKNKSVTTSGNKSAYLSTVQRILQLKAKVEEDRQLTDLILLKNGNSYLKLNEFYFNVDDYYNCFFKIKNEGLSHPMCLEGAIKNLQFENNGYKSGHIELYRPKKKIQKGGYKLIPSVFINFKGNEIYNAISNWYKHNPSKVAVYSDSIITSVKKVTQSSIIYLNISVSIEHKNQLHFWT